MKLILGLVTLFMLESAYGQIPDYFANDPKWVCGSWSSNQWNPPYIPATSTYVYYLDGDTTIGGHIFHRLFGRGETHYAGPLPSFTFDNFTGYYLRQDNSSIRFYTNTIGIDSLLVSYNYQVGDTVKGDIFQACSYFHDTIQKIDSILIDSEYRKVFSLDSINGPVVTEGIGHQVDLNDQIGELIGPLCQGIGFDYFIFCFGLGTIPYWDSQGTSGNCILNVNVGENEPGTSGVYPNPFRSFLNVRSIPNTTVEIIIYDLTARIILRKYFMQEIQISTLFLENGIYLYELRHENAIQHGRIVKN